MNKIAPKKIYCPHDAFFKQDFGHVEVMRDFLTSRLPKRILAQIDMDSLAIEKGDFINRVRLNRHACDIVYSAMIAGKKGYFYTLLECQKEEDRDMALRLLEYNVSIMRHHLKKGNSRLPAIINLVLYIGLNEWKGPRSILEAFEVPYLGEIFLKTHFLLDLNRESDTKIKQDKKAALAELLLKYSDPKRMDGLIAKKGDEISEMLEKSPSFEGAATYIMEVSEADGDEILEKLSKLGTENKHKIMSTIEKIHRKGRNEGRKEVKKSILDFSKSHNIDKATVKALLDHIAKKKQ